MVGSGGFEPLAEPTDLILSSNGFTDRRPEHSPYILVVTGGVEPPALYMLVLQVGNDPTTTQLSAEALTFRTL